MSTAPDQPEPSASASTAASELPDPAAPDPASADPTGPTELAGKNELAGPTVTPEPEPVHDAPRTFASSRADKLPVKMLSDRILVNLESDGERRSTGGILIPATAQLGRRLAWGEVVALGPNVRSMEVGDQVLFNPEDRYEVEVRGTDYIILRERDVHAVASKRLEEGSTGLYL